MNVKFKKAFLDGGLVFIGIFLALILENYFADIELKNKQNRLLEELIVDLDETISDIANDTQSYKEYVDLTKSVINILNQENIPIDLAVIPLMESGNNPQAKSPKDALGLWQFIPATAKEWGLLNNFDNDERKNVIKSTKRQLNTLNIYIIN